MSDLSVLTDKQLVERHRHIADKVAALREKLQPMFEEYDRLAEEFLLVDRELAKRNNLPTASE